MNYDFDIIVIGASPSGYMAAFNSKYEAENLNVCIFEKKEKIDEFVHPANSFYNGMFSILNEKVDKSYILNEINGMKIFSPSLDYVTIENKGWAVDKLKFDKYYYDKVNKLGINIFFDYNVIEITIHPLYAFISVINNGKIKKYISKMVIISNGVESNIVKLLNINTTKYKEDIAWGIEANITCKEIGISKYAEYFIGSHAPGWKSSYLPMGNNSASIGIYIRHHGKNINNYFDNWVNKFKEIKGIHDDDLIINNIKYGGDPIITIPNEIYGDRILVTGGSAGQSGIAYGMAAGKIAGTISKEAVLSNNFSKQYLSKYYYIWKKQLYIEHILGRCSLEFIRYMNDNQINYLFKLFKNQDINTLFKENTKLTCLSIFKYLIKKDPFFYLKLAFKK